MLIFGGCIGIAKETNDLYSFNFNSNTWNTIYEKPLIPPPNYTNVPKSPTNKSPTNKSLLNKYSPSHKNSPKVNVSQISMKNADKSPNHHLMSSLKKSSIANESMIMVPRLNNTIIYESDLIPLSKRASISPERARRTDNDIERGYIPSSPTYLSMKNSFILNAPMLKWKKTQNVDSKIIASGIINGSLPCERDGHTVSNINEKMIVFGGDRHQMGFNDIYVFSPNI